MTEWLELMLDEVRRKKAEEVEEAANTEHRGGSQADTATPVLPAKKPR